MLTLLLALLRRWLVAIGLCRRRGAVRFALHGAAIAKGVLPSKAWYLVWAKFIAGIQPKAPVTGEERGQMADIIDITVADDGLLTALPLDATEGPAGLQSGTIKVTSGDNSIIGDGVLSAPEAPGQTAFAFRCAGKGLVGQQATMTVTAKSVLGADVAPATLIFRIVDVVTPPGPEAVSFSLKGEAVAKNP